jgi:DNA polymerase-3 subunit gamma/tau
MSYTVLARRYRSQRFDDVVGQTPIAQTLKNAVKTDRVAHAYLFTGTRGVGKTTMARILAKALNCLNSDVPTPEPCCKCDSCVGINIGEDIDVIEIDGASNTGVDDIRQLRQNAIYRPARARYKIYIIDEVHMLSTSAFNALLKILEEPPEHVKFIFATTEPNKVLATIQSRCQRFDFSTIGPADITGQLKSILKAEKIACDEELMVHLARLANGSMRDGLSLLDQLISTGVRPLTVNLLQECLGQPNREKIYDLLDRIGSKDAEGVLEIIDHLLSTGQTCTQLVDCLIDCMRDLMVIKSTNSESNLLILTADERKRMSALAENFDIPALIYNITTLERLHWTIKNSDNPRALLEASMLRLALSEHFMDVNELLSQLNASGAQRSRSGGRTVKKKRVEPPIENKVHTTLVEDKPAVQTEPVTEGPVESAGVVDIELIRTNWQAILASVKGKNVATGGFLDAAEPADWHNNVLTVSFPQSAGFARQMCENREEQIETLLSEAIGTETKVQFESSPDQADISQARQETTAANKKKKDEALNDPAVRTLLSGLNATVTGIDKVDD